MILVLLTLGGAVASAADRVVFDAELADVEAAKSGPDRTLLVHAAAIQRTIDRIASADGGTVELPAGRCVSGSPYLKDGIDFYLAEGAMIVAGSSEYLVETPLS